MSRILLLFTLLLLVSSCEEELENTVSLTGKWEWVRTSGGLVGSSETPASTGVSRFLVLRADSVYGLYVNQELVSSGKYGLKTRPCIHSGSVKPSIYFSAGLPEGTIEELTAQGLRLSDENHDGYGSSYRKATGLSFLREE
ncbi:MAG: hypothetical protein ACO1OQ_01820 [Rufibacter sp.]